MWVNRESDVFGDRDIAAFLLRLSFGETAPGDLGIGENYGGNGRRLECDSVSGDGLHRGASLMRCFVRQHGLPDHVANRINGGIVGPQLLVHLNESERADSNLRFVQASDLGIRLAPY